MLLASSASWFTILAAILVILVMPCVDLNPFTAKVCMKEMGLLMPFIGLDQGFDIIKDYDVILCANSHQIRLIYLDVCLTYVIMIQIGPLPTPAYTCPLTNKTWLVKVSSIADLLGTCLQLLLEKLDDKCAWAQKKVVFHQKECLFNHNFYNGNPPRDTTMSHTGCGKTL